MKKRLGFGPEARIRKTTEFQKCQLRGDKLHSSTYVLLTLPCEGAGTRLGVVVTKRTGTAVVRNRWKRMAREVFRLHRSELRDGRDHVLIVRGSNEGPPTVESRRELETLMEKVATR